MANWYVSSVAWTAVTAWAATTAYIIGDIRRQLAAPTVGNERVWRCTTAGTSGGSEPAWTLTKGSTTTSGTAVFTEITGQETFQGTSWAAPFARLSSAFATGWAATGDTVYVSADHAETTSGSITITARGSPTNMAKILCVTRPSAAIPPASTDLTTGATVTNTGNTGLTFGSSSTTGSFYCYGIAFSSGSGAVSAAIDIDDNQTGIQIFDHCKLKTAGTSGGKITFGPAALAAGFSALAVLNNTDIEFSSVNSAINAKGRTLIWNGGSLLGTAPTSLIVGLGTASGAIEVRNVDLSLIGAAKFLVTATGLTSPFPVKFINCKLATNLGGVMTGTIAGPAQGQVDMVVSDSTANVIVREEHYRYAGSMVQDTTNTRVGGASDGITTKAWKLVTLSAANWVFPLFCPDIIQWVGSTGSKTITMYIANTAATLTDQDVGFEVEYLGTSAAPLGTFGTSQPNVLATASNLSTDTSTWNSLSSPTKQKVTKTITINQVGYVRIRPFVAKPSATVYIDPKILVA